MLAKALSTLCGLSSSAGAAGVSCAGSSAGVSGWTSIFSMSPNKFSSFVRAISSDLTSFALKESGETSFGIFRWLNGDSLAVSSSDSMESSPNMLESTLETSPPEMLSSAKSSRLSASPEPISAMAASSDCCKLSIAELSTPSSLGSRADKAANGSSSVSAPFEESNGDAALSESASSMEATGSSMEKSSNGDFVDLSSADFEKMDETESALESSDFSKIPEESSGAGSSGLMEFSFTNRESSLPLVVRRERPSSAVLELSSERPGITKSESWTAAAVARTTSYSSFQKLSSGSISWTRR